jgi:antitoxin (DNA-binding transcriptional repressor) of toxin-antitoxin stability system
VRTINQRDLRNDSSAILRAVEAGESMVVAKSGIPIAELRPLRRAKFVPAATWLAIAHRLPQVDAEALRQDVEAHVDPEADDPYTRTSRA